MAVDIFHAHHHISVRFAFPAWLHQNNSPVPNVQLGTMAPHSNAQSKAERVAKPFDCLFYVRIDEFGNYRALGYGSVLQHLYSPQTFKTTFPNCAPDSRYSCASLHSCNGKILSTTGFSLPAATSFSTVANSSFVPI